MDNNNNNGARYLGLFDNVANKSTIFYPFMRNAQCESPSSSSSLPSSSALSSVVPARKFTMASAGIYFFVHFNI